MSYRAPTILAALAISTGFAQQNQPPADPQVVLRSTAQEVMLDFIARDKNQKLVTNLRLEDIEILEDGVPQRVRSFQYRHSRNQSGGQDEPEPARAGASGTYAPLREINLVSLVFEGLSADNRRQATQAAKDFLANEVNPDTYIAVFTLNHRLALLQQYTNDPKLLNQAVDRAAGGDYQKFAKDVEAQVTKLNSMSGGPTLFQPIRPGSAEERGPRTADRFSTPEAAMAALTVAILSNQAGNMSIDALRQLIHAQSQLPGRKTILYVSEGLIVPPEQPELFRGIISEANRANVTFYALDPSGLDTMSRARLSTQTTAAINITGFGGTEVMPTNYQENLRTLAEDTGGFLIADTNDMRMPLRRVMEEVRAHYEVAYAPTSSNYDGHFRTIEIRARRPGLHLQSRKGYFALPMLNGETVAPFEMAALNALNTQPLPHAFDFHSGVLTFRAAGQETECRAVFSIPSRALHFTEDSQTKLFHIHVSFLGLVKDEQDQVVGKISRDLLFQAPSARRQEFERGEVTVTLPLPLPPGRYHLEAVAVDRDEGAASARRIALFIPSAEPENTAGSHVALSDLVLVRSIQAAAGDSAAGANGMDPLEFSGGKVTPEMNDAIPKASGAVEGVYFVLYPGPDTTPDVRIAISHNGALVTSVQPGLPLAGTDGSLRIMSRIPFNSFDAGIYEITVTAAQAGVTARRTIAIRME